MISRQTWSRDRTRSLGVARNAPAKIIIIISPAGGVPLSLSGVLRGVVRVNACIKMFVLIQRVTRAWKVTPQQQPCSLAAGNSAGSLTTARSPRAGTGCQAAVRLHGGPWWLIPHPSSVVLPAASIDSLPRARAPHEHFQCDSCTNQCTRTGGGRGGLKSD